MECRNETLLIQVPPHGPPHRSLSQGGGHRTSACSESREQSYLITSSWCTHTHMHACTHTHTHTHTHKHTHSLLTLSCLLGKTMLPWKAWTMRSVSHRVPLPFLRDLVRLHRDDGAQGKDEGMDVLHVEVVGSHCV